MFCRFHPHTAITLQITKNISNFNIQKTSLMNKPVAIVLTTACLVGTLLSYGRTKADTDSAISGNARREVIKQNIGDADDHKFGKMIIEQIADKYYITFPLVQYLHEAQTSRHREDEVLPAGTTVTMNLGPGKVVHAATAQNISTYLHYRWISCPQENRGWRHVHYGSDITTEVSREGFAPGQAFNYYSDFPDLYALNWMVRFECTHDDMLLLSRRKITGAYITKAATKLFVPIKKRQSIKIRKSISGLVRGQSQ
jgi:hypothetical protein